MALLLGTVLGCPGAPPSPTTTAHTLPIEPGCYLVEGAAGDAGPPLPSHLILTAEPSLEAADRFRVRLRREGERVDAAGWWHRTPGGVLALLDRERSGGLERLSIASGGGEVHARLVTGSRTRSVRLFAGCD